MTIPKEAIEKARSVGWNGWDETDQKWYFDMMHRYGGQWVNDLANSSIALDPTFWQALGKALEWAVTTSSWPDTEWLFQAHRFYDLILTNKSTEQFWKEILAK